LVEHLRAEPPAWRETGAGISRISYAELVGYATFIVFAPYLPRTGTREAKANLALDGALLWNVPLGRSGAFSYLQMGSGRVRAGCEPGVERWGAETSGIALKFQPAGPQFSLVQGAAATKVAVDRPWVRAARSKGRSRR
jgi:hypothetical protein